MNINACEIYNQNTINITKATHHYADVQLKLSAGRKVVNPSDNPAATVQALECSHQLAALKQYDIARRHIDSALSTQELVLNAVAGLLTTDLPAMLVMAGNGTYPANDRQVVAKKIDDIRTTLLDLCNTKNSQGRHIFSGYKTNVPAFSQQGVYLGGEEPIVQTLSNNNDMQSSFLGSELFPEIEGVNLFTALQHVIDELNTQPESDSSAEHLARALKKADQALNHSLDQVGLVQARIGSSQQQLRVYENVYAEQKIQQEGRIAEAVGADNESIVQLISQLKMAELTLNLSQLAFQNMQRLSLFSGYQ